MGRPVRSKSVTLSPVLVAYLLQIETNTRANLLNLNL